MRILHISETDYEGGAGKAAFALHRELRKAGVDSLFLGECVQASDPNVYSISGLHGIPAKLLRRLRTIVDQGPLMGYRRRHSLPWSMGWLPRRLPSLIDQLRPDLVHLHWISEMLPIQTISRIPVPIVWTHHDWGAVTGGCRCPGDCRLFERGCGTCPQLSSTHKNDLTRWVCERKRVLWKPTAIHSVAVGEGIGRDIRRSWVLGSHPCTVIPNGIDTDTFKPQKRNACREALGLDPREFVIFFGACSLDSPLKGGSELVDAMNQWKLRHPDVCTCLLTVGSGGRGFTGRIPFSIKALGRVESTQKMAQAYNAADVVVVPSRVESFGLVAAEAQACGIPVVAFSGTGADDIVRHRKTGFLCSNHSSSRLADGVNWVFQRQGLISFEEESSFRKRKTVMFSMQTTTVQYKRLYSELVHEFEKANQTDCSGIRFQGITGGLSI